MSVNSEIAKALDEFAQLYAVKGDNFRSRAYMMASRRVESLTEDLRKIREKDGLDSIPGIGKGISLVIEELLDTGESKELEELKESLPLGLLDLLRLEGVGPKTALRLNNELNVTSVDDLEKALQEGRLKLLKGFGPKTEENLLASIAAFRATQKRFLLGSLYPVVAEILSHMSQSRAVNRVEVAGSARRKRETVGDLDLVASSTRPEVVTDWFVKMPGTKQVVSQGTTRSTIIIGPSFQVDLRVVEPESFGAALQYLTGSVDHNVKLRTLAIKQAHKLNEYGLYDRDTDKKVAGRTEEEIYAALGLSYIEPELREDRGEIEAAAKGTLPRLVEMNQIRGDLHIHTEWSDGSGSIAEMADKARQMNLEYIAICDHSKSLAIAHGLDEQRLIKQMEEIDALNKELNGFTILKGIECDIKSDGTLDLSRDVLKDLDFVVASIHSGFKADAKQLTQRMVKAVHSDLVSAIGHPTGRIIQERRPYPLNLDEVFQAAVDCNVAMEINAFPNRLDLDDINSRSAKEKGAKLSIGTDAHAASQMDFLPHGVYVARRAWLEKGDIVNTKEAKEVLR